MLKTGFVSLIALAAAAPALADEAGGEQRRADEIIVTASRSGEGIPLDQLGASVTVIDATAMEQRQTRIVSDVLRDVPGLAVSRVGAIGGQTQVRVRGTEGNHVLVLIDGIEAADPYFGEFDFGTLIADPEARIEVLRGQQSSLYGSDAIGGVINYITLSGAEAPGMSARVEGGSFGTFNGSARVAGVAGDSFDYTVSGAYFRTNGTPTARNGTRDIGSESLGLSTKLNWTPAENFKISAVARYSHVDADFNNTEYDASSPWFGYIVDSPGVHYVNRAFYGLLSAQYAALEGRWVNTLSGQITNSTRKGYSEFGRDSGNEGQRYKGSFASSLRFGNDNVSHKVTGAVDLEREQFRNTTPSDFVFGGRRSTDNVGLVGQYELLVNEALSVGGSVRYDDNNRFDNSTTWRLQGSYAFETGTRLRGAYGTGIKNPGYYELFGYSDGKYIGNPNLRPEKSEGWEVGVEQSFGDLATIGATYFNSTLRDEIFTSYPAPDYIATPDNRDTKSKQKGVEVFLSARPVPQVRLEATYTYLDAKENGTTEIRRPKHVGSLNTTVSSRDERLSGTLTFRYNGRQDDVAYTDPSYVPVPVSLKDYVLVNLGLEYKISEAISVYGRVENLLDERYEEVFSYATSGRACYGGVRVRF